MIVTLILILWVELKTRFQLGGEWTSSFLPRLMAPVPEKPIKLSPDYELNQDYISYSGNN